MNDRITAAEALVKSLRTGELSAANVLAPYLSDNVTLEANGPMPNAPTNTVTGRADVFKRLTGNWAVSYALRHARWATPVEKDGVVKINATFEMLGGVVPQALEVSLTFDAANKISKVEQKYTPKAAQPTDVIPPAARPLINNARTNETPILVAHTDENGDPVLTFRGSLTVYSDTELCAWIRAADGGLVRSIAKNPKVSMAYRDGARAMLLMKGRARIENDDAVRQRVYNLIIESEQNHDPARKGAAMIIEVDSMMGFTTGGEPVRMARKV
jgi:hypothetical protein